MREANRDLTFAGVIVVAPVEADEAVSVEQKILLDALHLRKIDLADRVLVVNPRDTSVSPRAERSRTRAPPANQCRSRRRLNSKRLVGAGRNEYSHAELLEP
ncbi:hypothetical protein [Rhodococcus sp. KB6]|uniref:hypothetical protein n=1 Tax=Rhodococcus sp. KB6 TaxID=1752066 RepID=UPI0020A28D0B|nr:hypothetical protein [Rhodococcus sp. KB6]